MGYALRILQDNSEIHPKAEPAQVSENITQGAILTREFLLKPSEASSLSSASQNLPAVIPPPSPNQTGVPGKDKHTPEQLYGWNKSTAPDHAFANIKNNEARFLLRQSRSQLEGLGKKTGGKRRLRMDHDTSTVTLWTLWPGTIPHHGHHAIRLVPLPAS